MSVVMQASPFNSNISLIPNGLTSTHEYYETRSPHNNENIQQASSGQANVQNCEFEFQNRISGRFCFENMH